MKVLVTGSTGMVGQNICNDVRFQKFNLLQPSRKELNLFNKEEVQSYLKKHNPDLIIHTAGRVGGIQANIANPVDFLVENIDINRNLIDSAYRAGVKRLINLGSSCMYPKDIQGTLKEEMILTGKLEPTNEGYALAKIMAQRLCSYIKKENSEFNYKTVIPCNLYGPFDKFDEKNSHLIPAIISKLKNAKIKNESSIEIWGDGNARREFMYVEDLVSCLYKATESYDSLPDVVNVGLGYDYSVNEYYKTAAEVVGFNGTFSHDLSKPTGMKQKLTDVSKAQKWGWKSQISLEDGLKYTLNYYQEKIEKGFK